MATTPRVTSTVAKLREAEDVYGRLHAALAEAGIVLPSLRVDLGSCAGHSTGPLLELGGCNMKTAERLVAALSGER